MGDREVGGALTRSTYACAALTLVTPWLRVKGPPCGPWSSWLQSQGKPRPRIPKAGVGLCSLYLAYTGIALHPKTRLCELRGPFHTPPTLPNSGCGKNRISAGLPPTSASGPTVLNFPRLNSSHDLWGLWAGRNTQAAGQCPHTPLSGCGRSGASQLHALCPSLACGPACGCTRGSANFARPS